MSKYDILSIINKITEKTNSNQIIWTPYDPRQDTNPYSFQYFITIDEFVFKTGYSAKYQYGYIFLMPGRNDLIYLFVQSTSSDIPIALNYGASNLVIEASLKILFDKIKDSFSSLDSFFDELMN